MVSYSLSISGHDLGIFPLCSGVFHARLHAGVYIHSQPETKITANQEKKEMVSRVRCETACIRADVFMYTWLIKGDDITRANFTKRGSLSRPTRAI